MRHRLNLIDAPSIRNSRGVRVCIFGSYRETLFSPRWAPWVVHFLQLDPFFCPAVPQYFQKIRKYANAQGPLFALLRA